MKSYAKVMNDTYALADEKGKASPNAWLDLDGIWWPNPHYKGESVAHPECDTEFHPPKGPRLRERFQKHLAGKK